jgi:hypothetical protein
MLNGDLSGPAVTCGKTPLTGLPLSVQGALGPVESDNGQAESESRFAGVKSGGGVAAEIVA